MMGPETTLNETVAFAPAKTPLLPTLGHMSASWRDTVARFIIMLGADARR